MISAAAGIIFLSVKIAFPLCTCYTSKLQATLLQCMRIPSSLDRYAKVFMFLHVLMLSKGASFKMTAERT
jgi:hypothetical protein